MKLYTVGHGTHNIGKFISLLDENGIALLVDVRSSPCSRYNPQFNKENLAFVLPQHEIQYAWAGKYLGGRPSDPTCYRNKIYPQGDTDFLHLVDYPEVMKRRWFVQGVRRLIELADEQVTAIMCSEEDPAECHRHHLIAKYIMDKYPEVDVHHIRGDSTVFGAASILVSVYKPEVEQLTLF